MKFFIISNFASSSSCVCSALHSVSPSIKNLTVRTMPSAKHLHARRRATLHAQVDGPELLLISAATSLLMLLKVMGFVGIQTGFGSTGRTKSTWMLQRLEEPTGWVFRFVIGRTSDNSKMKELTWEVAKHDDFLSLDIEEECVKLSNKMLAFFKAAHALQDSGFYVKADDGIYLRPGVICTKIACHCSWQKTLITLRLIVDA